MAWLDTFDQVLGTLSETYSEVVTADNTGASPSSYSQAQPAVQPTGQVIQEPEAISVWLKNNWILLVLLMLLLVVVVVFLKWV